MKLNICDFEVTQANFPPTFRAFCENDNAWTNIINHIRVKYDISYLKLETLFIMDWELFGTCEKIQLSKALVAGKNCGINNIDPAIPATLHIISH